MKSASKILSTIIIVYLLAVLLLQPNSKESTTVAQRGQGGMTLFNAQEDTPPLEEGPIVGEPVIPEIRPSVKDLPLYEPEYHLDREINPRLNLNPNFNANFRSEGGIDPLLAVQASVPQQLGDGFTTPLLNFDAQKFSGVNPPDTVGDVGPNHYIQIINSGGGAVMVIYDKNGAVLAGPTALDSLGTGACADGLGDGIVLYDRLADRWMISEFSNSANMLCVYVSQGPDAVNDGWYAYTFSTPSFPDYPKYGVWPDAYYVSSNENDTAVYALDRNQMLTGAAATSQRFTAPSLSGFGFQALTPSDLDGAMAPPAGSPNYFMRHRDDEVHNDGPDDADNDFLEIWAFDVDFNTPANSSFTKIADVEVSEFDSDLCGLSAFECFPQPNSNVTLDPLREVVMWRLQYRNFGTHEVLVGNLVTDVNGNDHGGIRWFELRKSLPPARQAEEGGSWTLFQEGTFAPDAHHRWMGSIAMDGSGNMALGYSVSSSTVFPSLRYVGRLASDTAGTMPHGESNIISGSAANSSFRWGDYSAMSVDPADDCTFWYTNMYSPSSSWRTRIATFKFDDCGEGSPTATPTATSTPTVPTATPTVTSTPTVPTATPTPSNTPIGPTFTPTPTVTPVGPTVTPTATEGGPTFTPTPTITPGGPTLTPTATATEGAPTFTRTPTITPGGPTLTPTATATEGAPTLTPTPTITPGGPTVTLTPTGGCSVLSNRVNSRTNTTDGPTNTPMPTGTPCFTPSPTNTPEVATATNTPSQATVTNTPSQATATNTAEVTLTPTAEASLTPTAEVTLTPTAEASLTPSTEASLTPSAEATLTPIATATDVPSVELACNGATVGFEDGIPSNWPTPINEGSVYWSTTADTEACGNGMNQTGGSGFAACADSDRTNQSPSESYDTEMWTPAFDLSEVPTATLQFAAAYRDINPSGGDHFEVDVWDGASWNNALNWNEDHREPGELVEIDLTDYAGQSDVKVRFRYYGNGWDWWSQVDEVQLSCGELTQEGSITLQKTVGTDPEVCAASDSLTLPTGGGEVTYCYEVINTSLVTFELHELVDSELGSLLSDEPYTLAPAESFTHLETTTVTTNTTNSAIWTASSKDGSVSAEASDSAEVRIEALCGATIQSVGNGEWDQSETWDTGEVPDNEDIVLIQQGHVVSGGSVAYVEAFCNYGTLQSPAGESLKLEASSFFENYGDILGLDGEAGTGNSCGVLGSSLDLRGKPFLNEGTIQAGDGGDGERCGGAGGTARIMAHNSSNSGLIAAGKGGDVTTTGSRAALDHPREMGTYVGGRGGDTHVRGNFGGSGFVDNSGTLQAGDGGNGHPNALFAQSGGNGGCLYIYASSLSLTGNQWAGLGGEGTANGPDGMDGCVSIDPSVINFSGPNTTVRGGDIEIFGGDDWVLDLSDMATGAISATGNLMLAVGEGGSVDLRDNQSQVFEVAGEVTIASDEIELDEETELSEVIQATKVQTQAHQILVEFDLDGPGRIVIEPKSKQMLDLTVLNNGPMTDTYTLSLSDPDGPDGWAQDSLPSSITIAGLESADLQESVMIVPPAGAANGDMTTLTLMATSASDPTQIREFEVEVVVEGGSFMLHLPLVTRD